MLDNIDLHILRVLQRSGRISNQDLADKVGLSPSPCLRRVRELESSGIVQKYVALVNPGAVGQSLQAFVEVRLDHQTRASAAKFETEIVKLPQVLECYMIVGDWDYLLRIIVRDLDALRDFHMNRLGKIPGVTNVKSNISMKAVKYSTALPLDE
jgi:Lrp/AsnC family leucine-responsive transcriptional regulator